MSSRTSNPTQETKDQRAPSSPIKFKKEREMQISHVQHRYTIQDNDSEVFSAKFSQDCSYMAASYADGTISVYSSMLGDSLYNIKEESIHYPITAICWKPAGFGFS
jgi:WD40 repeat protein